MTRRTLEFRRQRRRARCWAAAAAAAVLAIELPQISQAQIGGTWAADRDGSWSDPTNWISGAIPDSGGLATFPLLPAHLESSSPAASSTRIPRRTASQP